MSIRVMERWLARTYSELPGRFRQRLAPSVWPLRPSPKNLVRALRKARPDDPSARLTGLLVVTTAQISATTLHRAGLLRSGVIGVQFLQAQEQTNAFAIPKWGQIFLAPGLRRARGVRSTRGLMLHELLHLAGRTGSRKQGALAEATTNALVIALGAEWYGQRAADRRQALTTLTHPGALALPVLHEYLRAATEERRTLAEWILALHLNPAEGKRLDQELQRRLPRSAQRALRLRARNFANKMRVRQSCADGIHEYCGHSVVDRLVVVAGMTYAAQGWMSAPELAFLDHAVRRQAARRASAPLILVRKLATMLADPPLNDREHTDTGPEPQLHFRRGHPPAELRRRQGQMLVGSKRGRKLR